MCFPAGVVGVHDRVQVEVGVLVALAEDPERLERLLEALAAGPPLVRRHHPDHEGVAVDPQRLALPRLRLGVELRVVDRVRDVERVEVL